MNISPTVDETHDPRRRSWIESANRNGTDFPIQNLPFGVFLRRGTGEVARGGVAIGDYVVDMAALHAAGILRDMSAEAGAAAAESTLNRLMGLGTGHWNALRHSLSRLLSDANAPTRRIVESCLVPIDEAQMLLPADIGNYTDFYAGIYHAMNVGTLIRPDNPLPPNYKWIPIGYHGRASSVAASGTPVRRPNGQTKAPDEQAPRFGPCRQLDYELELGIFVGAGNQLGSPIPIGRASEHAFGVCLLNDWSARDIQTWEYQPLGPFLAKSFATTISPWVVTFAAMAPFRIAAFARPPGDPAPLPYLTSETEAALGGIDLEMEAFIRTARMRKEGRDPIRLTRSNFRHSYWTVAQMIAHHTSNGCNLRPGDLLGSGTISGPDREGAASLLEITGRGRTPLLLAKDEAITFLEDGDEIVIRGRCDREGFVAIGFGECRGMVTKGPPS